MVLSRRFQLMKFVIVGGLNSNINTFGGLHCWNNYGRTMDKIEGQSNSQNDQYDR